MLEMETGVHQAYVTSFQGNAIRMKETSTHGYLFHKGDILFALNAPVLTESEPAVLIEGEEHYPLSTVFRVLRERSRTTDERKEEFSKWLDLRGYEHAKEERGKQL